MFAVENILCSNSFVVRSWFHEGNVIGTFVVEVALYPDDETPDLFR